LGDNDKALTDLTQALEIDPNRSRVYHFRSEAYYEGRSVKTRELGARYLLGIMTDKDRSARLNAH
jgi:Tfp pilus assembly protein PilF